MENHPLCQKIFYGLVTSKNRAMVTSIRSQSCALIPHLAMNASLQIDLQPTHHVKFCNQCSLRNLSKQKINTQKVFLTIFCLNTYLSV